MNKYLVRPWHLYRRHGYFRRYFEECQTRKTPEKLHIGCGNRPIPGWCNVDVAHLTTDVQYVDALKPLPFPDASFQYVVSEHFVEHLSFDEGLRYFQEAFRILKPGGILRTATPNLDFLLELQGLKTSAHERYVDYTVKQFVPNQPRSPVTSINLLFYGWGHRFIYSPAFMKEVLMARGFTKFSVFKSGESQSPVLKGIEQHGKSVPPDINELETFALEAVKEAAQ